MRNFLTLIFPLFIILGCGSYNKKSGSENLQLHDNISLYSDYDDPKLIELQVNIPVPNDYLCAPWYDLNATPRPCTLDDILHDTDPYDNYRPKIHVDVASDYPISYDGMGLMYQKGKSTRRAKQKSFRIKLDKDAPFYEGQHTFQLNKHPYDKSRVRNKLFFDLFVGIPNMTSLRTNFTHLIVDQDSNTTDFGLFTHVEQVDKYYLLNHHLEDGKIYKAQRFDFRYKENLAIDAEGVPLHPKAFDQIIEPQKGSNHKKLIEMIKAVDEAPRNKTFMNIFNKYFDYNNYVTWMAINYVTCNADTINQNFFLYNPKGSDKFFFIPWDYDGASTHLDTLPRWQLGFGRYWDIPLHKKFLLIKENREAVKRKIDEIHQKYINRKSATARLLLYRPIVEPFIKSLPDSRYLKYDKWVDEFESLPNLIEKDVQLFKEQEGLPMPFWQSVKYNGTLTIAWQRAVDFENDPIVYDIKVAKNPLMQSPILQYNNLSEKDLNVTSWGDIYLNTHQSLKNGIYYLKIIAKEKNNPKHYQLAFDMFRDKNNTKYYGVLQFQIPSQ